MLGGVPTVLLVECAYDFLTFIKPYADEEFSGWGHSTQSWFDKDGSYVEGRRGSMVHYLHFFKDPNGYVRLRYKTAATDSWLPKGPHGELPDGKSALGVTPFKIPASELPIGTPPFAQFNDFDENGEIRRGLLSIKDKAGVEFMPPEQHLIWQEFFDNIPPNPSAVSTDKRPAWGYFSRQPVTAQVSIKAF